MMLLFISSFFSQLLLLLLLLLLSLSLIQIRKNPFRNNSRRAVRVTDHPVSFTILHLQPLCIFLAQYPYRYCQKPVMQMT